MVIIWDRYRFDLDHFISTSGISQQIEYSIRSSIEYLSIKTRDSPSPIQNADENQQQ